MATKLNLLILSVSFISNSFAFEQKNAMGQRFLVALPAFLHEDGGITFYLSTLVEREFKVKLTSEWLTPKLSLELSVKKDGLTEYELPVEYHPSAGLDTTCTYKFLSRGSYLLTIVVHSGMNTSDTFLAIPVESWGTNYVVYNLDGNPFIQIITDKKQDITAILNLKGGATFTYMSEDYKSGDELVIVLRRWESFSIWLCNKENITQTNLTGTHLTARHNFGVISGNCDTYSIFPPYCQREIKSSNKVFTKMQMPISTSGLQFVVPKMIYFAGFTGYEIMTSEPTTSVTIPKDDSTTDVILIEKAGDTVQGPDVSKNIIIESDKPIMVFCIQFLDCSSEEKDSNYFSLIPIELFYNIYTWRVPDVKDVRHHVLLVILVEGMRQLRVDNYWMASQAIQEVVVGSSDYIVVYYEVSNEFNFHSVYNRARYLFGCYIFGWAQDASYMYAVGYQACGDTSMDIESDDQIDNDCDGKVDEELMNDRDDDGDNLYDEDTYTPHDELETNATKLEWADDEVTMAPFQTHPVPMAKSFTKKFVEPENITMANFWGLWQEWVCYTRGRYRERKCFAPMHNSFAAQCEGNSTQYSKDICIQLMTLELMFIILAMVMVIPTLIMLLVSRLDRERMLLGEDSIDVELPIETKP